MNWKGILAGGLGVVGVCLLVAFVLLLGTHDAYIVPSAAMTPTIGPGDSVFVREGGDVSVGDVVVFDAPPEFGPTTRIGRVVGLGGDALSIEDYQLLRNGETVEEDYLAEGMQTAFLESQVVPDGHFFSWGTIGLALRIHVLWGRYRSLRFKDRLS